jgi:hypothetical protein
MYVEYVYYSGYWHYCGDQNIILLRRPRRKSFPLGTYCSHSSLQTHCNLLYSLDELLVDQFACTPPSYQSNLHFHYGCGPVAKNRITIRTTITRTVRLFKIGARANLCVMYLGVATPHVI